MIKGWIIISSWFSGVKGGILSVFTANVVNKIIGFLSPMVVTRVLTTTDCTSPRIMTIECPVENFVSQERSKQRYDVYIWRFDFLF